jgi:hypothetical protein
MIGYTDQRRRIGGDIAARAIATLDGMAPPHRALRLMRGFPFRWMLRASSFLLAALPGLVRLT